MLAAAGDDGGPKAVEQLKTALTRARTRPADKDHADALLGWAFMSGGVSCKDGIALFERGMAGSVKRFYVLAALPEKPASPAVLGKLAAKVQEAVVPGRAVAAGDAVAMVVVFVLVPYAKKITDYRHVALHNPR